ncbi:MAG: N-acetylneuraminate lyase, partial [Clostridia bacterium]|nr:N-acetylneuraminate lyase [Clostridia bacterium]
FNGPDEQLLSGLAAGATGGIGGTYAVMPELYLKIRELYLAGKNEEARQAQNDACRIIYKMCTARGNLYAVMKAILKKNGLDLGGVRLPLAPIDDADRAIVDEADAMIRAAVAKHVK